MRHLVLAGIFVAFTLGAAGPGRAQTAIDPDRLAAAQALGQAMGGTAAEEKTILAMRGGMISAITQTGHQPIGKSAELVDTVLIPQLKAHIPEIAAAKIKILARLFTVAELNDIRNFYATPTGQKLLANQSAIGLATMQAIQPLMRDIVAGTAAASHNQPAPEGATP